MIDIVAELNAVHRAVGRRDIAAGEGRTVTLRRDLDGEIEDVWDAITDPERLCRWLMPVSGELRVGGRYQLQGNAGGEILRCEPPKLLHVTWVYGEDATEADVSEVVVRLSPAGLRTVLELEHAAVTDPERWGQYGPGAVGVGWDLALLGLLRHLGGGIDEADREAWGNSPEARTFMTASSDAWGAANEAAGATSEEAAAAVRETTAFYVPPEA
jgi:uncharacterized protein YndB with AHSA1/START domain